GGKDASQGDAGVAVVGDGVAGDHVAGEVASLENDAVEVVRDRESADGGVMHATLTALAEPDAINEPRDGAGAGDPHVGDPRSRALVDKDARVSRRLPVDGVSVERQVDVAGVDHDAMVELVYAGEVGGDHVAAGRIDQVVAGGDRRRRGGRRRT